MYDGKSVTQISGGSDNEANLLPVSKEIHFMGDPEFSFLFLFFFLKKTCAKIL
jgi:hypothetical protein